MRQNICPLRPKFFKCDKPSAPVTVLVITSGKVHGGSVYVLPPTPKKLPQKRRKIYFIQGVVLLYCISEIPFVQPPSTIRKEISGTFFWRVGADVDGPIWGSNSRLFLIIVVKNKSFYGSTHENLFLFWWLSGKQVKGDCNFAWIFSDLSMDWNVQADSFTIHQQVRM